MYFYKTIWVDLARKTYSVEMYVSYNPAKNVGVKFRNFFDNTMWDITFPATPEEYNAWHETRRRRGLEPVRTITDFTPCTGGIDNPGGCYKEITYRKPNRHQRKHSCIWRLADSL